METDKPDDALLRIAVAYALPERQVVVELRVEAGCTVAQAIELSGLEREFPNLVVDPRAVGIFSRKVSLEQVVEDGDRVEIYRPLIADPKESRRKRAKRA